MGEDASAEQLPVRPVLQVRPEARSLPAVVSAFHPFGSCRVAKIVQGESKAKEKRVFLLVCRAAAYLGAAEIVQGESRAKEKRVFLYVKSVRNGERRERAGRRLVVPFRQHKVCRRRCLHGSSCPFPFHNIICTASVARGRSRRPPVAG